MKTIYLHIGMPKTGTSSIQKYLFLNKDLLEERGVLFRRMPWEYVDSTRRRNAHFLFKRIYDENGKQNPQAFKERLEEGWKIIDSWLEASDNIILTDEALWNMVCNRDVLEETMERCQKRNVRLVVIAYLRSQDDFVESYYAQKIEEGWNYPRWGDKYFRKMIKDFELDYQEELEKVEGIVGRENMIIRIFDRDAFVGGSIIDDFLSAIGVDDTEGFEELEEEANITLTPDIVEIKRYMNRLLEGNYYAKQNEDWPMLRKLVKDTCLRTLSNSEKMTYFTDESRAEFMGRFVEENRWVARRFFDRDELFPKKDSDRKIYEYSIKNQVNALADMIGTLYMDFGKRLSDSEKRLSDSEKRLSDSEKRLSDAEKSLRDAGNRMEHLAQEQAKLKETFMVKVKRKVKKILGK